MSVLPAFERLCSRLGWIQGESFEDELAHVYHFHHHPVNILLHFVGFLSLAFTVVSIAYSVHAYIAWAILAVWAVLFFLVDVPSAVLILTPSLGVVYWAVLAFAECAVTWPLFDLVLFYGGQLAITGALQLGLGHVVLEGERPAFFSSFEVLASTPVLSAVYIQSLAGLRPTLFEKMVENEPKFLQGHGGRTCTSHRVEKATSKKTS